MVTGSDARQLAQTIRADKRKETGPMITMDGKGVSIAVRNAGAATVWPVRYDLRVPKVNIGFGENSGRVLPYRNVVTGLRLLGTWKGNAAVFDQPVYREANERSAILVQQGAGGPIIGAKKL